MRASRLGTQPLKLGDLPRSSIERGGDGHGVPGQHEAGFGEANASADPLDHSESQPLLEPFELLTDGGLTVTERGCGRGDGTAFVHRSHDAQGVGIEVRALNHGPIITTAYGLHRTLAIVA